MDIRIPSKTAHVITVLDSDNCDLPRREAVRPRASCRPLSVCLVPSRFLFLCSDSSGAMCFQGSSVSVCTRPLPGL